MGTNGNNRVAIDCPKCQQRFTVAMPKPEVLNTLKVSAAVATHEKPVRCMCGAYFALGIQHVNVAWAIMAITDEQASELNGSRIIVPVIELGTV